MNCETCQELIHDLIDGSITERDEFTLNTHLNECLDCESVRQDLTSIVGFCRTQRGEYEAPPNAQAMWLRIRNVIEAELPGAVAVNAESRQSFLGRLLGHSWELSLPQLAASAAVIVLVVSMATVVGLRRFGGYGPAAAPPQFQSDASNINDRVWQRRQVIDYWNQRIELRKASWNPEMRASLDRSVKQLDEDIAKALDELKQNPQDEFYKDMLNDSLNSKINLLKDFSDL